MLEDSDISKFPGFQELREECTDAIDLAASNGDTERTKEYGEYLGLIMQAVRLHLAFAAASRYRLEDRANEHAPGKVSGRNSVTQILGLGRNAIYSTLKNLELHPVSFSHVDRLGTLVARSPKLSRVREDILDYLGK